jgi:non-heme chloroperoxidase
MHRRSLFKSAAATIISAGLFSRDNKQSWAQNKTNTGTKKIPQTHFIETKTHASLFYKDWGEGKPIIFIHSWAFNSDMWQYQMNFLTRNGIRCIAYDRRGHGRSSQPGHGYDYDTLADDLAALISNLDLKQVTLVSHSMGAGEIVRYLSRYGANRIARILIISGTTPFILKTLDNPDGVDKKHLDELRAVLSKDAPHYFASGAPRFLGKSLEKISPEMIQWGTNLCVTTSLKALVDCTFAMSETDFRAEMRRITIPTLIIHGDEDFSAPFALTGQRSAQLISGSQLKVYEGAPHGLFLTHMEQLNSDILEFMQIPSV